MWKRYQAFSVHKLVTKCQWDGHSILRKNGWSNILWRPLTYFWPWQYRKNCSAQTVIWTHVLWPSNPFSYSRNNFGFTLKYFTSFKIRFSFRKNFIIWTTNIFLFKFFRSRKRKRGNKKLWIDFSSEYHIRNSRKTLTLKQCWNVLIYEIASLVDYIKETKLMGIKSNDKNLKEWWQN